MNKPILSRLALRHLLAIVVVAICFVALTLAFQVRALHARGVRSRDEILHMIHESYVPPVAAALFFFDDHQMELLTEGIVLLQFVRSVRVYEKREGEFVPIIAAGTAESGNGEKSRYPLIHRYDGEAREIGALIVTTSLAGLRGQVLEQIRFVGIASVFMIFGFAFVVLVVAHGMVFRHLKVITSFIESLNPEQLTGRDLVLPRTRGRARLPDELDEITSAINTSLQRLDTVLAEKTALVQELYHRTGNTMQLVRSILRLRAGRAPANEELQTVARAVDAGIMSIALAHQHLFRAGSLSRIRMREYLIALGGAILHGNGGSPVRVRFDVRADDVSFLIDTAVPCGMIVTELLSNSVQHAFPDGDSGTVTVALHRTDEGLFRLTVTDDGIGTNVGFDYRGSGKSVYSPLWRSRRVSSGAPWSFPVTGACGGA